ncbi:MAG: HlyD family efflux transporter periplasmic adaptor subunit [Synechococcus sp.]|nr:HlyD family efflux transporter periplasmic adaptor subunit [Synechococcus sp.]
MNWLKQAQTALEQSVATPSHDETVLQQSRRWMRLTIWSLMGTAAFGVGWLALAQTEEIVVATGKLEPIGSVREVQMPVGGIAAKILVKDGDQVKAGQILMQLDTEAGEQNQRSLQQALTQRRDQLLRKEEQLSLKDKELARYLEMNGEEISMLEQNLALDTEILSRFERLAKEGASAELQYLQQRNKVQETQGRLMQTRVDRLRQKAILEQGMEQLQGEISGLRAELADLQSKITEARVTLRYAALRSPANGVVFDLKPTSPGYAAQSTTTVMKIVPFDKLQANVEIDTKDIGFVRVGMPADLSIDSFPATDFGVLEGTVKQVGSDALAPDPQKQRELYRFPASIQLASQQLKLKSGRKLPLQVGMSLTAHIKLRKVTYLQLLLSDFKDKADSLRRI